MKTSQSIMLLENAEVTRDTPDDYPDDQQVVVRDYSGNGYSTITFFAPTVASADALVAALKGIKRESVQQSVSDSEVL